MRNPQRFQQSVARLLRRTFKTFLHGKSVLQLALDPATRVPRAMRFWFNGKDAARAPDEEVTYVGGWRLVRGIRVAETYKIDGGIGGAREAALLEWSWK